MMGAAFGLVVLLTIPLVAWSDTQYECQVITAVDVNASGKLEKDHLYVGVRFFVDRRSGVMLGRTLHNAASSSSVEVIDYGGDGSSFAVLTTHEKDGGHFAPELLEIQVWRDGPKKPFVLWHGLGLASGLCE
jgi:hypothetical protein